MSRVVRCPRCKKSTIYSESNPYRPFCSERCQQIDLGAWADERYRVPSESQEVDEVEVDEDPEDNSPN